MLVGPTRWRWLHLARTELGRGRLDAAVAAYARARRAAGGSELVQAVREPVVALADAGRLDQAEELLRVAGPDVAAGDGRLLLAETAVARDLDDAAAMLVADLDVTGAERRRADDVWLRAFEDRPDAAPSQVGAAARRRVLGTDVGATRAMRHLLTTCDVDEVRELVGDRTAGLPDPARADLCRALAARGHERAALDIAREGGPRPGEWWRRFVAERAAEVAILDRGPGHVVARNGDIRRGRRVLYVARMSLPESVTGYSTRTQGLLEAMLAAGIEVTAATEPGFGDPSADRVERVGAARYRRLAAPENVAPGIHARADAHAARYGDVLGAGDFGVVHAASNWRSGWPALVAARRAGLPFVYEVRGLWELTRLAREPEWEGTDGHRREVRLETEVATAADRVLAINTAVADELVRRGVPRRAVALLPNAVDAERFRPGPRDRELEESLGLRGLRVIGFAGNLRAFEGLEDLVAAVAQLRGSTARPFRVVIVGDGESAGALRSAVDAHDVSDLVILPGRVPHDEVDRWLSLFDVAPFPRRRTAVTEVVSPLKPLEAMATGAAVVVSDVAALAEMVEDGVTGLRVPAGDVDALTETLGVLVDDPEHAARLAAVARERVEREHTWRAVAESLVAIYRELGVPGTGDGQIPPSSESA